MINELLDRGRDKITLEAMQGYPSRSLHERLDFKDTYKIHYLVKFYGEDRILKGLPDEFMEYVQ